MACLCFCGLAWFSSHATAHPLGDFSINQYFALDGSGSQLRLYYLLDVAEIPSFSELDLLDTNFDSEISQEEVDTYLAQRIPQLERYLSLSLDGAPVEMTLLRHKLMLLHGNAGMVVFNIRLELVATDLPWPPEESTAITVTSENYPREQGTRECLVYTGKALADLTPDTLDSQSPVELEGIPGIYKNTQASFTVTIAPGFTPPTALEPAAVGDFSWTSTARLARELGEEGMLAGTPQTTLEPGMGPAASSSIGQPLLEVAREVSKDTVETGFQERADTVSNRLMDRVSAIVRDPSLPTPLFVLGLLIAVVLGMGHALSPGHGKTVMAAYLIGERGTVWHAAILGVVVTITHTWSVIFLGLVTLYFRDFLSEEQVNFWTGIFSGVIIIVIGVVLFRHRYHRYLASAQGGPDDWRFYHGHDHEPDEPAPIEVAQDAPPTYKSILWLGVSGGVVPCPAALIVLLLALKVGRLTYGLALLVAFSLGLALVLVAIGVLVVRASRLIQSDRLESSGLLRALPLGSAALITVLGGWVVVWTLLQFNVLQFG